MTDPFDPARAEAIRRLTEVELDAILLREVCHSRQNWQRDGDWHDWIEISPDERERLVAAAKSVARLTAQVETLQGELETATANFHGYVELLERADAAEAQVTELQGLLGTATTLAATHFDRANAAEAQVETLRAEADEEGNVLFDSLNDATAKLDAVRQVLDPLGAAPTIALDVLACALRQQVETLQGERDEARAQIDAVVNVLDENTRALYVDHGSVPTTRANAAELVERCQRHEIAYRRERDDKHATLFAAEAQVTALQSDLLEAVAAVGFVKGVDIPGTLENARLVVVERMRKAEAQVTALRALLRACAEEFGCWGGNKDGSGSHYCPHCDNVTDRNDSLRQQIRAALGEQDR